MASFFAVFALTSATLSEVIFAKGFGNSCNEPLFAKRPSKMVGSVRKTNSRELGAGGWGLDEFNPDAQSDLSDKVFTGAAELGMKPSCRHLRHHDSKSGAPVGAPASSGRFAGSLPAFCRGALPLDARLAC